MHSIPNIDPSVLRDAYHAILELGMENLQRFRLPERFEYLAIEIDPPIAVIETQNLITDYEPH